MKHFNGLTDELIAAAESGQWNRHIRLLFDYYADNVDSHIQKQLIADIVTRYVDASRQLEEKNRLLASSDERRLDAQRIALLGDWKISLPDDTLEWSEIMYEVMEYPADMQPSSEAYLRRVHPEDRPLVRKIMQNLSQGIEIKQHRSRLMMDDGRVKWVHLHYILQKDAEQRVVCIRGTLQDITQTKQIEDQLKLYNTQLEGLVQEKVNEIASANMATIYALVRLAESRDDDTGNHIERTASYCELLARRMREHGVYQNVIDDEFINNIAMASPLHDIGKVGIPDAILLKPARLTPEEFEVMKTHVLIGYQTLVGLDKRFPANNFLQFGKDIARFHHEKWDGSGYMQGLSGNEIPLSARIMALADVYDALRARRVYKEPYSHEKTVEIILQGSGTHFDPAIVETFSKHHEEFREVFDRLA